MPDEKDDRNSQRGPGADESAQAAAAAGAGGYVDHARTVLISPDTAFDARRRGDRGHAVIDLSIYFVAVFLAALVARITGYAGWDLEFGYFIDALKSVLTIAIPLALVILALNHFDSSTDTSRSIDFYLEKVAAGLLLPALLLVGALLLDLVDIRIHGWLRGLSMAFVYVLVFLAAYGYATPGRLKTACAFLAGFYIVYRLLALLL